jgi:hypothetical protein
MASSKTEICNIAMAHLGTGDEIGNIDTESSEEASACRRVYETALDETLRDFDWPFATRIAAAQLIEDDPNDEYAYSYRYPSNCIRIVRVLSGMRNDTRQSRVTYKIASDSSGRLFYTDMDEAEIEFIFRETNPLLYPAGFVMALSLKIAYLTAPRLTKGDPYGMKAALLREYELTLDKERARSSNEEQVDELPDSEFVRMRS